MNDEPEDDEPETPDVLQEITCIVDQFTAKCMEMGCDSVQANITIRQAISGNTMRIDRGRGNWYARIGSCQEWLEADREKTRINERNASA